MERHDGINGMNIPATLQQRLLAAQSALQQRKTVSIWHRQAIYAALGSRYYGYKLKTAEAALDRRLLQGVQQLRAGLPVYEDAPVPSSSRPAGHTRRATLMLHTLDYANRQIQGWTDAAYGNTLRLYLDAMHAVLDGRDWQDFNLPPGIGHHDAYVPGDIIYVATCYAWETLKRDSEYALYPLEPERDDTALKAFRIDTAGLVAIAIQSQYADGSIPYPYQPVHAQTLRFWQWWLEEAVPVAWNAVPTPTA